MKPQSTKIRESVPLIQSGVAHKCYAWCRGYSKLADDGSLVDCKKVVEFCELLFGGLMELKCGYKFKFLYINFSYKRFNFIGGG